MEDEKKRVGWWWACWLGMALAALLIVYPLSAGPVVCIAQKTDSPDWLLSGLDYFYYPAFYAVTCIPESAGNLYADYLSWWIGQPLTVEDLRWP